MKSFPLPYGQDIVTLVDTGDVLGMRNSHCSLMLVKLTAVARTLRRGCVGEPSIVWTWIVSLYTPMPSSLKAAIATWNEPQHWSTYTFCDVSISLATKIREKNHNFFFPLLFQTRQKFCALKNAPVRCIYNFANFFRYINYKSFRFSYLDLFVDSFQSWP